MKFNEYQKSCKNISTYNNEREKIILNALGLAGETGEVVEKIKKLIRDKNYKLDEEYKQEIIKEMGDVLWYLSELSNALGIKFEEVAIKNLEKLNTRLKNGTIHGDGDNR